MVDWSAAGNKMFRPRAQALKAGDIISVLQAMQVNECELEKRNMQLIMKAARGEINFIVSQTPGGYCREPGACSRGNSPKVADAQHR
ncbi:MAG: hypothetical protein J2P49_03965 [Methylocapsa sp.]|nr:hypothetical protein [Methylocapsa sp.]